MTKMFEELKRQPGGWFGFRVRLWLFWHNKVLRRKMITGEIGQVDGFKFI